MEKKYDHSVVEAEIREQWDRNKTYAWHHDEVPTYTVDTPPPTVSGSLHIGHIFSYTHPDILVRFARMSGHKIFYPFGFDDNGIPTERFVEKKREVSPFVIGRAAFIQACLEETFVAEKMFQDLWQSVGLSVDWNLWYSSISPTTRKISQESFIRLLEKGFIYRKNEPALFCTACRTSVAQAELDDAEKDATFNDILFYTTDSKPLTIGTTRPELLASCVAIFYHPHDERYKHLHGAQVVVPVYGHTISISANEDVAIDKGTGLVMCCTFGDKHDVQWQQKYNLPYRESIGRNGKMTELTGFLQGLSVAEARKAILKKLSDSGHLISQKQLKHAVNVHERCKKEIEYLILPQWFLKILDHKQALLDLADKIEWHPSYMKSRYINWVQNLGWDWCLSRQRFLGIPFPVWHCQDCGHAIVARIDQLPLDPQEIPFDGPCPQCGNTNIMPDTDVMDTWNTSSLSPYICYGLYKKDVASVFIDPGIGKFLPMSMRPQAHDIIRTWTFYTMVKTWMHHGSIPWKSVVISGHVLSSAAEKISKSRGNAPVDPLNLLKQWPADAIRFWTASGTIGTDVAFSETQLKIGQRLITKLWNAFLFVQQHVAAVDVQQETKQLDAINQWILHEASAAFTAYQHELKRNEYSLALGRIEKFFWQQFCDNYLELIKDRLFHPENYPAELIVATKRTLYWTGLRILQMYAPYMPFVTEKIYQQIYKDTCDQGPSVHTSMFERVQVPLNFDQAAREINQILEVIIRVRRLKTTAQLSLGVPVSVLEVLTGKSDLAVLVGKHEDLLRGITRAHKITVGSYGMGDDTLEKQAEACVICLRIANETA